ncbi:uncharacterized protein LOC111350540 [Spodoptera litura]|uniref:Uncharacterized protein LOC111350540 n=1 Tax=Spodoptera litura TaxID=69820 RepID=A0A9J7DV89_SPOLT|nr:uncharacterized protein LOC111350540 [Spodoptera litura]
MALDVRASGNNGLLLLIAIVNVARSPEMRYGIAHVCVEDAGAPRVSWLVLARGVAPGAPLAPAAPLASAAAPEETRAPDEAPRFLPLPQRAMLYTSKYIALVSTTMSNDKVDYIDVASEGDKLLGAELCDGVPLLFSLKHGVLALSQPDAMHSTPSMCESPMGSPCPSDMYDGNLSLYEIDPHEVSGGAGGRGGACLGSSAALQLDAQLRDKQRAFGLFCDFLRAAGLWQRLGLVTAESGSVVSTENALGELADLLSMAIALRKLQQGPDAQLVDAAINQVSAAVLRCEVVRLNGTTCITI